MKINLSLDCTPEEARTFLGQPGLKPMQEELMQETRKRMMAGIAATDPAEVLNDRVLPFFEEQGIAVSRVLTDRGTECCGNPQSHAYGRYSAVADIDHTRTRAKTLRDHRATRLNGRAERGGRDCTHAARPPSEFHRRARAHSLADGVRVHDASSGRSRHRAVETGAIVANNIASRCLKREAMPDDLTGALVFLAAADSDFMTGQAIVVDDGSVTH